MLEPILCGRISPAPFLPKLQGHFAEFLDNASPAGLRILSSSTCVGLRYGRTVHNSGFSWQLGSDASLLLFAPRHVFGFCTAAFPSVLLPRLPRSLHSRVILPFCVPAVLIPCGTGFSTCSPSATLLSLALGPDLPRADQLYPGNLGYSAWRIPTSISLLIPAFSLLRNPPLLPVRLPLSKNAPLPIIFMIPKLRCRVSAPDIFGAGPLD